jgi:Putative DNA-binding domain
MALIDVERAIVCVCFKAQVPEQLLAELGDRRTFMLYREMVRDRLRKELRVALPRTRKTVGDEAFERAFVQHLDRNPPRTRFFHRCVLEFARDAVPMLEADSSVPPWSADLARFEAVQWEVSDLYDQPSAGSGAPRELAFDRPPWLAPALRLVSLAYPVHETRASSASYTPRATRLCVHRAPEHIKTKTWLVNASTHRLLELWQANPTLSITDAVRVLSEERNLVTDQSFVDGLCGVLAEFIERGVVLGSR